MKIQTTHIKRKFFGALIFGALFAGASIAGAQTQVTLADAKKEPQKNTQIAVFSGGCFWGVEAVFEHVKGVNNAWSGYAGGKADTADYYKVSSGTTGHAESVKVSYDPAKVSYGQLLRIFFSVAHDPTQLNRQGPDTGTQYRSAIFYTTPDQERVAKAYIAQLTAAKSFSNPIVTQVKPLTAFYMAEGYHQDFARLNPDHPYIVHHDLPKVANLKKQFPQFYKGQ